MLGSGGMGIVLRACDPNTGEQVAIKLLRPDLATDPVALFRREARHMAQLAHPNILRVSEVAGEAEWPYYVMPHLAGGPLSETIHHRPLDEARTLHIARQVAAALAYAHARGLIHRDLKPSNILLDEAGQAYLADFGLARPFDNDTLLDLEQSSCVGTVPYMSPAVAKGEAEDTRCDIYSFGAVLREMLTGRPPYKGHDALDVLRQVMTTPPEPISSVNPHAHPGLMRIAEGAMAHDLRDRYASMTDVIADLDRVARGQDPLGPHDQPPGLLARWRRRLAPILIPGSAAMFILLGLAALAFPGLLYRHLSAGDLDPTFGHGGKVFTDLATFSTDGCRKVLIQPDGKILAVGRSERSGQRNFALVRYTAGGSRDSRFGDGGVALTPLGEEADSLGVTLQADGKIVVVGNCGPRRGPQDITLVRYNADGTLDHRFGKSGVVITDLGGNDYAAAVAVQPDGRIVVAGHTGRPRSASQKDPPHDFVLLRYNSDGSPDRRFGKDGVVLTELRGEDEANAVALQPDGKIVVGGHSGRPGTPHDFAVVRYNADGSLDDGSPTDTTPGDRFGPDGMVFTDFGGRDEIWSIILQPDGKVVAGGFSWRDVSIDTLGIKLARYTADGRLDPSFGAGGKVSTDLPGEDEAFDFALQPDGKILAAVTRYPVHNAIERRVPLTAEKTLVIRPPQRPSPSYDIALVRYNADGTLDAHFGREGVVFTDLEPDYKENLGPMCGSPARRQDRGGRKRHRSQRPGLRGPALPGAQPVGTEVVVRSRQDSREEHEGDKDWRSLSDELPAARPPPRLPAGSDPRTRGCPRASAAG